MQHTNNMHNVMIMDCRTDVAVISWDRNTSHAYKYMRNQKYSMSLILKK